MRKVLRVRGNLIMSGGAGDCDVVARVRECGDSGECE